MPVGMRLEEIKRAGRRKGTNKESQEVLEWGVFCSRGFECFNQAALGGDFASGANERSGNGLDW